MSGSLGASRAQRRAWDKRDLKRSCHADVVKILFLSEAGRSVSAIAASTRLGEELVREILRLAAEVEEGEGVSVE